MGRGWGRERERGSSLAQTTNTTNTNSSDRERGREGGRESTVFFQVYIPLYLSSLAATIHFNYLQFNTEIS